MGFAGSFGTLELLLEAFLNRSSYFYVVTVKFGTQKFNSVVLVMIYHS